ncbi:thioredoxin family protein [uncultured Bacteroides sp.]|uniref:thioredoxin family protein n=1 Tax=uncultured Bacteroides sp. TaxID=162156 RepID=UPI002AA87A53|nr:thioredoxin family protein [uncultured Bacteroides sp.]
MMKRMVVMLGLIVVAICAQAQVGNLDEAMVQAKKDNKLILLKFSGSDWCGPCIQLQKTIIDNPAFTSFANEKLVLLLADFPRQKKNQLTKEKQEQNDKLAEKYNPEGEFPYMVLLDADGKVLYKWSGYDRKLSVQNYVAEIGRFTK